MRTTILLFALSLVTLLATSCKKCNNDDPTARIINNGSGSADVQIKAADGNLVQISDLTSGSISSTKEYVPGTATVKYAIGGEDKTESISLETCTDYDITINSENKLVIFSQEKN